jgi:hypothetical protein
MVLSMRPSDRRTTASRGARCGGLAVALGVGIAVATGNGVAWADTAGADSAGASVGHSRSATGTHAPTGRPPARPESTHRRGAATATAAASAATVAAPDSAALQQETPVTASRALAHSAPRPTLLVRVSAPAPQRSLHLDIVRAATPIVVPTITTATVDTTPSTPTQSPIAKIVALPGRIVNALLGLVGITTSAANGPSPISPAPIAEFVFVAFRRLEEIVGLDAPRAAHPVLINQTYTGSLTTPTPTVAQFLNAASAEYVLGGVPAGLKPFTVNGWPMTSTNTLTGESALVWVTPQNQIIIAYQGTTGGTHLLVNPLIAVSQIVADIQGISTNTTPAAFDDSLEFAHQVQAEAALQGYAPSDIFVTGHSLGGWEAEYVSQYTGLGGIGFESLGLSATGQGNGADSLFVNVATYGDPAAFLATDLPGLQPFIGPYVAGGGSKPHYGSIVLVGDPSAQNPMSNASAWWGTGIVGDLAFGAVFFGQFFSYHLPGVQAYNLDVDQDPGVVPWLGITSGPVYTGYGELTIPEFMQAASDAGILIAP